MVRLLIFLVGMLATSRGGGPRGASFLAEDPRDTRALPEAGAPGSRDAPYRSDGGWADPPGWQSARPDGRLRETEPGRDRDNRIIRNGRRRLVPLRLKWAAVIVVIGLIFRKIIAWAVLVALSATLHVLGINVHLPRVRLAWPWQSISAGTTTNIDLGPWVLQKIEGISRPALGTENFNFTFTHKVSKSIGIWPCWYSSTFEAVGHASATVNLNPGPAWWAPGSGHYDLQVLSRPVTGEPGRI